MKRTFLLVLFAALSVASVMAQGNKGTVSTVVMSSAPSADHFIINGNLCEQFDGKVLVGETITSYTFIDQYHIHIITTSSCNPADPSVAAATKASVAKVTTLHAGDNTDGVTVTSASGEGINFTVIDKNESADADSKVCVVDGKVVSYDALKAISPSKIESMEVIKSGPSFKKYAKAGTSVVLLITTRK